MRILKNTIGIVLIAMICAIATPSAMAQGVTISSSFGTVGQTSTGLFVKGNNSVRVALSGTWVGTVRLERTNSGAAYDLVDTFTANGTYEFLSTSQDFTYRLRLTAYTSGTVSYILSNVQSLNSRIKYSTVPIGSVAYASLGSSVSVTSSTAQMTADLMVLSEFTATGIGVMTGATTGTNTYILALYNSSGRLLANTDTAGTANAGPANAFQEIAFIGGPVILPAGRYFVVVQMNGTTDKFKAIAASTFIDVVGAVLNGAAFGTTMTTITPPTTFTADKGPIAYIY